MRLNAKTLGLFLIMVMVLFMLAPTAVFAAEGSTVEVKGYIEEGMNEPDLSVSNVTKTLDAAAVDEILDGYFETQSPTVITTLNDTAIFEVYKMLKEGDVYTSVGDPIAVSGKAKIYVPSTTAPDGYVEKTINVSELKNYEVDIPNLLKGCNVTLTEPGYYSVHFVYEALAGSTYVLINVKGENTQVVSPVASPAAPTKAVAKPTASKVMVNGIITSFDAYNIDGSNYFKLRDLAKVVTGTEKQFQVEYNTELKAINLLSNSAYTAVGGEMTKGDGTSKNAVLNTSKILKDGKEVALTAYNINGNNYFKLRDLAGAFNIGVTWDGKTNTVGIDTKLDYVAE